MTRAANRATRGTVCPASGTRSAGLVLAAALLAALGCGQIENLADPPPAREPAAGLAAQAPAPSASDAVLNPAPLLGPVFPGLAGVHSASCDPSDPYSTCL